MAESLPPNWSEAVGDRLVVRPVAEPFVVQMEVALPAKQTAQTRWLLADNKASVSQDEGDAAVTVILSESDAVALANGDQPLALGFMRGAIKLTGDAAKTMELLKAATPK